MDTGKKMKRATAILVALAAAWSVSALAAAPSVSAKLSADKQILHALSRLTFGARPGDIERVRVMGLEKWIDLQLHPERIGENPVLEAKLRPLESLRMSSSQLAQTYPGNVILRALGEGLAPYPADPELRRALEFAVAEYMRQLQPAKGDPDAQLARLLEPDQLRILRAGTGPEKLVLVSSLPEDRRNEVLDALPGLINDRFEKIRTILPYGPPELQRTILQSWYPVLVIITDRLESKLSRAIYSKRQLQEVLTDFWFNHFNVVNNRSETNNGSSGNRVGKDEGMIMRRAPFLLGVSRVEGVQKFGMIAGCPRHAGADGSPRHTRSLRFVLERACRGSSGTLVPASFAWFGGGKNGLWSMRGDPLALVRPVDALKILTCMLPGF